MTVAFHPLSMNWDTPKTGKLSVPDIRSSIRMVISMKDLQEHKSSRRNNVQRRKNIIISMDDAFHGRSRHWVILAEPF
jgi:hypothetical protein